MGHKHRQCALLRACVGQAYREVDFPRAHECVGPSPKAAPAGNASISLLEHVATDAPQLSELVLIQVAYEMDHGSVSGG